MITTPRSLSKSLLYESRSQVQIQVLVGQICGFPLPLKGNTLTYNLELPRRFAAYLPKDHPPDDVVPENDVKWRCQLFIVCCWLLSFYLIEVIAAVPRASYCFEPAIFHIKFLTPEKNSENSEYWLPTSMRGILLNIESLVQRAELPCDRDLASSPQAEATSGQRIYGRV